MTRRIDQNQGPGQVRLQYHHGGGNWEFGGSRTSEVDSRLWIHTVVFIERTTGNFPDPLPHDPLDDLGSTIQHGNQVITVFQSVYIDDQGRIQGDPPVQPINTTRPGGGGTYKKQ